MFRVAKGGTFDRHYHDCDEYWFVFRGKARVVSEGKEYVINPGDVLCTRMGKEHDVLEVYEELGAFWVEDELKGRKRFGHIHRPNAQACTHLVK